MIDLHDGFLKHLAQTSPHPLALDIVGAEGCHLLTRDGRRYLDLVAGLAVNNVGHRHPKVVQAIKHQCDRYLHVIPYGEFIQGPQVRFAEKLTSLLPASLNSVYFVNSGTEAIEASLKLAKRATGRTKLVGCRRSYHGSTHGSLSLSDNETKKYRNRPLLPDVEHITFNDPADLALIDDRTAAVVVEPIQGDAGVRVPHQAWMTALRERCSEVGTMLVFDEVQTGFGRTGKLFAFEHFKVVPDILVLGKALGGGMPMGAFISSQEHMKLLTHDPALGHITTFGGHPVACAAGLAALEVLLEEDLIANAIRMGDLFRELLVHPAIREVRGKGLMLAVDLGDADKVQRVVHGCLEQGVLGFWFLSCPEAFRLAPPLMINEEQAKAAVEVVLSELGSS
ncbi:MAG: aspartate aminotransferase family protein [Flavobacteriales bacterium]|jgi:acetylornithine/N-succinyldiaminopimelate aminotransferase|nr:aspartate aminotransferase family protein [Flavobacteriales bacterium]MBK6754842.1 aspartate aminotransferase family protein [Flavobacteriales bacterium]MBK7753096.1 aspartate aminotransferase family protein [Flavobacteriales bacterium]MBK9075051.1 aspartate aminotransferase family protein [Flavobacteriales bacterium]MBK9540091.1 aspartate aminotransferase family protein [Flavobacteriales bacterium]